ncbi:Vegetative incompatibility protein HET-E-1 [Colletotrichum siamense]|uniref:Vegetative incompatibility protein HET-E-1 n=1 Tax=Colletotrichum siamense TaxID=690259 RepID=A0A9P5F3J5_COLSI|nr:Vegetative incompatibility protein HET-E-1 [Colletotrichum siamense]KAF4866027.1 Vegetative incompatibility protein HET-E-1 [Colletotrichum siamense]
MTATQLPGLRRKDFHVAIICAVDCEYDAVIFAFDEIWDGLEFQLGNAPGDHNKYKVGRIANRNAVLLLLPGMGKANAASGAASLRSSYTEIKLAIVTGICGGVPGVGTDKELLLGDVVISKCIVQYDLGRRYSDRFATKEAIEDSLGRPHESSGLDRDQVAKEKGFIAFEMEAAGIWDRFPCIVVKAVCDYADSHKNKKYQNFAAARAAAATKATLEAFPFADGPSQSKQISTFDLLSPTEAILDDQGNVREKLKNRRKLLEMLAADHEAQKSFNPKKVLGTCEWFLRDQRYRQWLESTTSSVIWVSAGPGCGKSVLARALIDDGQLSTNPANTIVCYFFFKDGYDRRVNSHDALSSVLHQIFTKDLGASLISHADRPHKNYGASLQNNFHQLWEILVACASQPESREIVCVLDALDECCKEGRQDIFRVLEPFYFGEQNRAISSRLKLLVTSRPYDDLEIFFDSIATAKSYIRSDGDDKSEEIRREIDLVIDQKVNEFGKDFGAEHRHAISERLKAMESRTYLWLHLTLGIIDEKRSVYRKPSSVQKLLSRLPSSVFDAYEKILSRSQDEEQARTLLNILLATTRPLTLDEVNWALTLHAKDFTNRDEIEDDIPR